MAEPAEHPLDTGIFFAYYSTRNTYHWDAVAIMVHALEGEWGKPLISDYILAETSTLLKASVAPDQARAFLKAIKAHSAVDLVRLDEHRLQEAGLLFERYLGREGLSFTDASSLQMADEYGIENIASFDERSFIELAKSLIGKDYWANLPVKEQKRIKKVMKSSR